MNFHQWIFLKTRKSIFTLLKTFGFGPQDSNHLSIFKDFDNPRDNHTDGQFRLLLRKRVSLYEYISSWNKFEETKLPLKKAFHSNFNMTNVNNHNYEHAQKSWK